MSDSSQILAELLTELGSLRVWQPVGQGDCVGCADQAGVDADGICEDCDEPLSNDDAFSFVAQYFQTAIELRGLTILAVTPVELREIQLALGEPRDDVSPRSVIQRKLSRSSSL